MGSNNVPHVSTLANHVNPLWSLPNLGPLEWDVCTTQVFENLRQELVNIQRRIYFDPKKIVTIQTDASGVGLGGVLLQNASQPVIFVSCTLTEVEKRYSTIEREFLAIVFTLNRLKTYLVGSEFEIQTDHLPIKGLMQHPIDKLSNCLQCWMLNIQHYEFKINYVAGDVVTWWCLIFGAALMLLGCFAISPFLW